MGASMMIRHLRNPPSCALLCAITSALACSSDPHSAASGSATDTSATDDGATDGGATDGGATDGGATDDGATEAGDTATVDSTSGGDTEGTPPGCTVPYDLPGPGETIDIPIEGRNVAVDVKPEPHGDGSWQYALFQSYGGGTFAPDASCAGVYVIAGSGGHNAAPCFGAVTFDFTTGTWAYLPNANGFDEARTEDIERTSETNDWPYLELTAATTPGMPAPAHTYQLMISPPASVLGGKKGAVLRTVGAAQTMEAWDSPQSHAFDLQTGQWSRASQNLLTDVFDGNPYTDGVAAYDGENHRIWLLLGDFSSRWAVPYLDLDDATWKLSDSFESVQSSGVVRSLLVDEVRGLLVVILSSGQLWAFDRTDVGAGPVQLEVSGTVPTQQFRWELYPEADGGDGSWYAFSGTGPVYESTPPYPQATEQSLHKLTPPDADTPDGPWTVSTVAISGGLTAQYVSDPSAGAFHHTRFFYVPALQVFAWIPNGTGAVELIRP